MYTITFYSFKGGVGRTLALVNVAAELARMGGKVLLVDFDLEAPGLETFERLRPPQPHPGVVEYVGEYRRTKQTPDVRKFIYSAGAVGEKDGQLWVMPAGCRDVNYQADLVRINWKQLYNDCKGFEFFEETKKQWEEAFHPDYVLIDSRTGNTDVEGICTRQLPDAVVVLFFPNEQNLAGLRDVCRRIRGERTSGLKKDIRLHFVMSNVPDLDDEDKVLHRRVEAFHKDLGIDKLAAVIYRYESVLLFNQAVLVLDKPQSRLAREYQCLVRALIVENLADRDGALLHLRRYARRLLPEVARDLAQEVDRKLRVPPKEAFPSDDDIESMSSKVRSCVVIKLPEDPLDRIAGNFLDDADVLLRIAECRVLEESFKMAVAVLNRALIVRPDLAQALLERAMCHERLGKRAAAIADLLSYLQQPGLDSHDLLRAFRQLAVIAPEKALEAVDLPASRSLLSSRADTVAVAEILAERDEGLSRAIQLLQGLGTTPWFPAGFLLYQALMRARRWRDALEQLGKYPGEPDLFGLAMIRWGETGELPEDLCRQLLGPDEEGAGYSDYVAFDPLVMCFILWRLGRIQEACSFLDDFVNDFREDPQAVFSYWTFRKVLPDQFLEDCQQLRRMFQGELIRPAFLGDPPKPPSA